MIPHPIFFFHFIQWSPKNVVHMLFEKRFLQELGGQISPLNCVLQHDAEQGEGKRACGAALCVKSAAVTVDWGILATVLWGSGLFPQAPVLPLFFFREIATYLDYSSPSGVLTVGQPSLRMGLRMMVCQGGRDQFPQMLAPHGQVIAKPLLYEFPRIAVANYHELGGFRQWKFILS